MSSDWDIGVGIERRGGRRARSVGRDRDPRRRDGRGERDDARGEPDAGSDVGRASGGESVATVIEPRDRLLGREIDPVAGEIEARTPTMEATARRAKVVRAERGLRLRRSAPGASSWR